MQITHTYICTYRYDVFQLIQYISHTAQGTYIVIMNVTYCTRAHAKLHGDHARDPVGAAHAHRFASLLIISLTNINFFPNFERFDALVKVAKKDLNI